MLPQAAEGAVDWVGCTVPGCAAAAGDGGACLAHLDPVALDSQLARFGRGRGLDARGVMVGAALLGRILAAAPMDAAGRRRMVGVRFEGATFETDVALDAALFGRDASFDRARFTGRASFAGARFEGPCRFAGTRFHGDTSFDGTTFDSQAWFMGAVFFAGASFAAARFRGPAWFGGADVQGDARFDGARFAGHAGFDQVAFGGRPDFTGAVFDGDAEFRGATFARPPVFTRASFGGRQGTPDVAVGSQTQWTGAPLASWSRRAGASLLDSVIPLLMIAVGAGLARMLVLFQEGAAAVVVLGAAWLAAVVWSVRNLVEQGRSGQTYGKRVVGLRLVGLYTQRPVGTARCIVRQVLHLADSAPMLLGWLWPLVDAKRQTFADKIARTVVVAQKRPRDKETCEDGCC